MGYYIDLRASVGAQPITVDVLQRRLEAAGVVPHLSRWEEDTKFGENDFMIPDVGILKLNNSEKVSSGQWGWVRLSSAAEVWQLERVIALAEKIGARLYDPSICDFLTRKSLVRTRPYLSAGRP